MGKKVRAACYFGYTTTPRADADRALRALLDDRRWTPPICAVCDFDHQGYPGRDWAKLRDCGIEILTDPATGGTFLVCRDMPASCRERGEQRLREMTRAFDEEFPGWARPR
ncbi:hypothetical protein ACWELJ_32775 [Nocardia sp. NPDC004582]